MSSTFKTGFESAKIEKGTDIDFGCDLSRWAAAVGRGFACAVLVCGLSGISSAQNLAPQTAQVTDLNGNPMGISSPGGSFLFTIPVTNVSSATQTNTVGVAVPLSDDLNVVNPVSDYGTVGLSATVNGTAYRGSLDADATVRRRYDVKLGLKSDQGESEHTVTLPGSTGFGDGSQLASWDVAAGGSGSVVLDASMFATEVFVAAPNDIKGGAVYKNTRTGEIFHVRLKEEVPGNSGQNKLLIKRGQYGVNPAPFNTGDSLQFEGVPIPDAHYAGVEFTVAVTTVTGTIGNVRLNIEDIVHPRMSDLIVTVIAEDRTTWVLKGGTGPVGISDRQSTPVIALGPLAGGLASGANITDVSFEDSATTGAAFQTQLLPGTSYQPDESFSTLAEIDGERVTHWTVRISDVIAPTVGYIRSVGSLEPGS